MYDLANLFVFSQIMKFSWHSNVLTFCNASNNVLKNKWNYVAFSIALYFIVEQIYGILLKLDRFFNTWLITMSPLSTIDSIEMKCWIVCGNDSLKYISKERGWKYSLIRFGTFHCNNKNSLCKGASLRK